MDRRDTIQIASVRATTELTSQVLLRGTDDRELGLLDWGMIYAQFRESDETYLRRQGKKQAELLVRDHVPVNAIELFGVY